MKKKEKELKPVSKSSIFIAWLLLIVLICGVCFITYLKFFGNNNENIEEYPVNGTVTNSPVITAALQQIVDNFNNSTYVSNYKTQNIEVVASLTETTIMVDYINGDIVNSYQFALNAPNLVCSVVDTDLENFVSIYKIIVSANQLRLGNQSNIDTYIDGFLNKNMEVIGLSREDVGGVTNFSIDVSKVIGEVGTEVGTENVDTPTSDTTNNVDTTTNDTNVTDNVNTTTNNTNTTTNNVSDNSESINNNVEGVE